MPRGSTPAAWYFATAAGVIVGAVYTVSPTTLWFVTSLPWLFAWAQRDLARHERRWVLGLLGVAVTSRLVVLAAFFLLADRFNQPYGVLIGDERYIVDRSLWMLNLALGHQVAPQDYLDVFGTYGQSGVQDLLWYWQACFGPAPYGAHLINVAMWLAGAIALHRAARRAFGPLAAVGGLAAVLFMPTLFVWSISALKEPPYFFLTAITIAGVSTLARRHSVVTRIRAAVLVACAVAAVSTVRSIALAVTAGGLVLAAAGWMITRRAWAGMAAIVLIGGGGAWAARQPAVQARWQQEFKIAAVTHLGNVNTPGYGYWLLDPYFYTREDDINDYATPADAGRFLIRASLSFFTVPLPWRIESRSALLLLPQQLAWYCLAAFACVGMVAGWRRDAFFTWVLVGNALLGAAAVALYNGNVGTLVRMRDSVVPIVVWLSALGGCAVLESAARTFSGERRHGHA